MLRVVWQGPSKYDASLTEWAELAATEPALEYRDWCGAQLRLDLNQTTPPDLATPVR